MLPLFPCPEVWSVDLIPDPSVELSWRWIVLAHEGLLTSPGLCWWGCLAVAGWVLCLPLVVSDHVPTVSVFLFPLLLLALVIWLEPIVTRRVLALMQLFLEVTRRSGFFILNFNRCLPLGISFRFDTRLLCMWKRCIPIVQCLRACLTRNVCIRVLRGGWRSHVFFTPI